MTPSRRVCQIALTLWAAWGLGHALPRLSTDSSLVQAFPEGSPSRAAFERFEKAFGTDDTLLVTVHDEGPRGIADPNTSAYLHALEEQLRNDDAVEFASSVAGLQDFDVRTTFGVNHPTLPRPLLPRTGLSDAQARVLWEHPLVRRGLVADGGRTAAVWILLSPELRRQPDYDAQVAALVSRIPRSVPHRPNATVAVAGLPRVRSALESLLRTDALRLATVALLVTWLGGAWAGLRGTAWRGLAVSGPIALGLIAWGLGASQRTLHPFSPALAPLVLVTVTSTAVHLAHAGRDRARARTACLVATATTSLGFGALMTTSLPPLRALGLEAAVGVWIAFGVTVVAVPPTVLLHRRRRRRLSPALRLAAGAVAIGLAVPWWLLGSERSASPSLANALPASHPVRVDAERAEAAFGGVDALEILITLPEGAAPWNDTAFWLELQTLQEALEADEQVDVALGLPTIASTIAPKLDRDAPFRTTPASAAFATRWLLGPYLGAGSDEGAAAEIVAPLRRALRQIVSPDGRHLRIGCRLTGDSTPVVRRLADRWERDLLQPWSERWDAEIAVTGITRLLADADDDARQAQRTAGAWALGLLAILIAAWARSVRKALWAWGTNAAALSGVATLMTFAGPANLLVTTALAATLVGIVVDDTVHLLQAARSGRARDFARVQRALRITSACLAAGLAVFLFSALDDWRRFGALAAAGLGLALWWDLDVLARRLRRGP